MAICPKRLKPRHIAVQGLRILLLHVVDELCWSLPDAPGTGKPGVTQGDMRSSPAQPVLIKVTTVGESFSLLGLCVTSVALQHGAQSGSMDMADLQICRRYGAGPGHHESVMNRKMDVMTLAKISRHQDLRLLQNTYYRETVEEIANRL